MAVVRDVIAALERIAPRRHAFAWDKVGFQVGDPSGMVERGVVSLDRSLASVAFARDQGAQMLVTHHPLFFRPLDTVTTETLEGRTVIELVRANVAYAAAHTNWDAARGGINDALAARLGIVNHRPFGGAEKVENLKLVFFAPPDAVDKVMDAVSAAGAGEIGEYRRCAFNVRGAATFEAGENTDPTIGEPGRRTTTEEVRVETVLRAERHQAVVRALRQAHPYEEPSYDMVPLTPAEEAPMGRVGNLAERVSLSDFVAMTDAALETRSLAWGDPEKAIRSVAVVGGAADTEWRAARRTGADVLFTAEVKQHVALEAAESGFAILSAGHYATEQPGVEALAAVLQQEVPDTTWEVFVPKRGFAGRPV